MKFTVFIAKELFRSVTKMRKKIRFEMCCALTLVLSMFLSSYYPVFLIFPVILLIWLVWQIVYIASANIMNWIDDVREKYNNQKHENN